MRRVAIVISRPREIRIHRRSALGLLVGSWASAVWAQGKTPAPTVKHLAIGNYGMKSLSTEEAIRAVAGIGFDGFELCATPEWDSSPAKLGAARRKTVGSLLKETGLRLVAVMENVPPSADDKLHEAGRERLQGALLLARDLVPDQKPMVQTVLGGGKWDEVKAMLRDRIGDWAKLAEELDATVCIKPHRFGAMSTPGQAAWLIQQLGEVAGATGEGFDSPVPNGAENTGGPKRPPVAPTVTPRLRMVYDYSHYAFRDLTVEATIQQARGLVAYVAMKDAIQTGDKVSFALPGETKTVDHAAIVKALRAAGYQGDFCCEVSAQLSAQAGYDPVQAAKTCYRNMAPVLGS